MESISSAQLRRVLSFAGELADLDEFSQVAQRVPELLRDLISCDHSGHNVINLEMGHSTVVTDPPDTVFRGGPELLSQFADQNPLIVEAKGGNCSAMRLSDYISPAAFHRTDIYNYVYKVVGLEHQLALQFPPLFDGIGSSQQVVGLSLARSTRDFSDSEQLLLEAIKPMLTSTLQRLHYLALMHAIVDTARDSEVLVLFDADHIVTWVTPNAQQRLGVSPGSRLPPELRACASDRALGPRKATNDSVTAIVRDQPVRVRWVADAYPGLDALYVDRHRQPGRANLMRQLGVTARQADVLVLLTQGHSTSEMADHLGISRRTVESHLDGIYRRLGVRNRGQAILAAIDHDDY
jgi:DNA-binding CsgD family transcriptional regulator